MSSSSVQSVHSRGFRRKLQKIFSRKSKKDGRLLDTASESASSSEYRVLHCRAMKDQDEKEITDKKKENDGNSDDDESSSDPSSPRSSSSNDEGLVLSEKPADPNKKRADYLSWDEFFIGVALLAAQRSKDPSTQVGAVIVDDNNIIVGVGYNGMPRGCDDDDMPWGKNEEDPLKNKYYYVCHAEMNAIVNKKSAIRDAKIYVTLFPCNECAKLIIQCGIKKVVYMKDKPQKNEMKASKLLFSKSKVEYQHYRPTRSNVVLHFD
ncbi:unnamed protein product [Bursaphelenchus xylophilus]|uniref:Probable deoxycytidylate deaminase n=1 Tax=Bursaphelenchus xylophilus TaxID=6326 RepID=A0A1I7S2A9_BURXY|nr:unnamed protein product [Bursaphelenchus xylophilus]CAG9114733.1 unnamed protein product [Bursaphelenchus xylophilus]